MVTPVLSFVIIEIVDHFVRIKSSDEETHLEKKQEFKTITNPWRNLFGNSNNTETKPKNKRSYEEIEDDEMEIEDIEIEIDDDTEDIDDYSEYDNYDTSDSFIDDEEIEEIYTGKYLFDYF
ncbi:hypothetical protein F8M41_004090 [Gigaspora margarita]|uniref:Uncharacterized protein n=1 Tax=Gigaspora margarita TaxID=4874 RepID=A0A8H3XCR4_GIGMA|nr:hypothetical protein F8M41_004090 [Gigaspora margarita]